MTWRTTIGEPVEQRRIALGYSKRAAARLAGVSEITWRQIESGQRQIAPGQTIEPTPEQLTKARVCSALLWTTDSIDRLAAGGTPIEVVAVNQPDEVAELREQVLRLAAQIELLTRATLAMGVTFDQSALTADRAGDR